MRLRYGNLKKVIYMCAAMLLLVAVHILSVYVFAAHQFTVSYDSALSDVAQRELDDYLRVSKLYAVASPVHIAQALRGRFPYIKKVACAHSPAGLHLEVKVHPLCVQLQDGRCVTKNNICVSGDYYTHEARQALPLLHCALSLQDKALPEELFAYVASVEPALLKKGEIYWLHEQEIICRLHEQPMQLVCNYTKKPTRELLAQCHIIADQVVSQPIYAEGFCADVRFDDRIVVTKSKNVGA